MFSSRSHRLLLSGAIAASRAATPAASATALGPASFRPLRAGFSSSTAPHKEQSSKSDAAPPSPAAAKILDAADVPPPQGDAPAAAKGKGVSPASSSPSPEQAAALASSTSAADLHPLPESVKSAAEPSPAQSNYASGAAESYPNLAAKNAAVHESRPEAPGAEERDISPQVAAPGLFGRGRSRASRADAASSAGRSAWAAGGGQRRSLTTSAVLGAATPNATSSADLHPLSSRSSTATSRQGSSTSTTSRAAYSRSSGSANAASAAAHSSRPAAPGADRPSIDPAVAAPSFAGARTSSGSSELQASQASAAPPQQQQQQQQQQQSSQQVDWANNYTGMSSQPFDASIAEVLGSPIDEADIEIKPDGLIYLPEIKYRRILNRAFGPGGWGLAPRGETNVGPKIVSREWVLVCLGRFVSTARGEQEYFDPSGIATASEGAKSNALMRCCKDLGIASELWDPRFIREFKARHGVEVWAEGAGGKKKKLWRRKDAPPFEYPWKEKAGM